MEREHITPMSQLQAEALIRTIPSLCSSMDPFTQVDEEDTRPPAVLSKGFIESIQNGTIPKKPALVAVVRIQELGNFSFRLGLYDGRSKSSAFSTARDLFDNFSVKQDDVPFVVRLDEVIPSEQTVKDKTMLVFFVKRAVILGCRPPSEAYEVAAQAARAAARARTQSSLPAPVIIPLKDVTAAQPHPLQFANSFSHAVPSTSTTQAGGTPAVARDAESAATPTIKAETPSLRRGRTVPPAAQTTPPKLPANITSIAYITTMVRSYRLCGIVHSKTFNRIRDSKIGHKKFLSFIIHDHRHDEIKISAYDDLADHYVRQVDYGSMYYIRSSDTRSVKSTNQNYNKTNHDCEITLTEPNLIEKCNDCYPIEIPNLPLRRTLLKDIRRLHGQAADVLAIIIAVSDIEKVTLKNGRETLKRTVTLLDDSNVSSHFVLWGIEAENFLASTVHTPLAIQGCAVKEYLGNYFVQSVGTTRIQYHPSNKYDHDTQALREWYANRPEGEPPTECISESADVKSSLFVRDLRTIGATSLIAWETLAEDPRGMYFSVVASVISFRRDSIFYRACPNDDCQKKVIEETEGCGIYKCFKCDTSSSAFKNVTCISAEIADMTGAHYVTIFGDYGNQLLGVASSDELAMMSQEEMNIHLDKVMFTPYVFRLRIKADSYNDAQKIQWNCYGAGPIPYHGYLKALKDFDNRNFPVATVAGGAQKRRLSTEM